MKGENRVYWTLLIVALVLMLGGSLFGSWINTGAGAATVQDVKFNASDGHIISAYLYVPKTATAAHPEPGILAIHGWNNQKDYMANTALELARRGYVVLNIDMTGHGYSTGVTYDIGYGAPDSLKYLASLPYVDSKNIGLIGMSMGGSAITAAAMTMPDSYTSMFYMESNCTSPCTGLKNVAMNLGAVTELGAPGTAVLTTPSFLADFGLTSGAITAGQVYGSVADGSARVLYQPWEDHAGSTDSPAAIGNAVDWFNLTLKGGIPLAGSSLIFGWKILGTGLAFLGGMLFLFPLGALLLKTSYFKPLVESMPVYKGFTGIGWWIAALITTAVGPLLYLWAWINEGLMGGTNLFPTSSLWPQNATNAYMGWAVVVGVIAIILICVNHFVFTKKTGATAANYGLTAEGKGLDWSKIWKTLLLAVCTLLPLYLIVLFVNSVWHVDFRAWVVALMPMNLERFQAFLGYLLPFAIFFVPEAIIFAAFIRFKGGNISLRTEMIVNSLVLTLGAIVWLLLAYIPIDLGGTFILSNAANVFVGGLAAIYYIPYVIFWPVVACLYTYFFRKTGRVYLGIFLVLLLMVWVNAAFASFGIMP